MSAEQAEAERLLRAAREHKRAARRHRDRAIALMEQVRVLTEEAAKRGVQITINEPQSPGGHSGQDRSSQARHRAA